MRPKEEQIFECNNGICKSQFTIIYEPLARSTNIDLILPKNPRICPFCGFNSLKIVDISELKD